MTPDCPTHKRSMLRRATKYGPLYICTYPPSCDMMKWGDSEQTSPANTVTRGRRHAAHVIFDRLWKEAHMTRSEAYQFLSGHLDKHIRDTHIDLFDMLECEATIKFANQTQKNILLEKFA